MVYRATKICSTYSSLDAEFNFIRQVASNNGYPMAFVESVIRRQLILLYEPHVAKTTNLETDTVVLRIPYNGKPSESFGKRVAAAIVKHYSVNTV